MTVEQTLTIIKPDGVSNNLIGAIYTRFEQAGLQIIGAKMLRLAPEQAAAFYEIHKEQPFFPALVQFMTSGPIMVQVLAGEDAVAKTRALMGATNPQEAAPGTIRYDFAASVGANMVHGSDTVSIAAQEINFFFAPQEILVR